MHAITNEQLATKPKFADIARDFAEFFMVSISRFSFGDTAAIVTSVALIVGLNGATATKVTIISGLLVVALADNLADSLSIHIYQESERLEERQAFFTTLSNFTTRLVLSISFVLLVMLLPITSATVVSVIWGFSLLIGLTYMLARDRHVSVASEIFKHVAVALMVISAARVSAHGIQRTSVEPDCISITLTFPRPQHFLHRAAYVLRARD